MSAQTNVLNTMLDGAFTGTIQIGLFKTGLPSATGVEVSGGSYARQTLSLSAAASKKKQTSTDAVFSDMPLYQTVLAWGIYQGATLIDEGLLSSPFTADVANNELNISYNFDLSGV